MSSKPLLVNHSTLSLARRSGVSKSRGKKDQLFIYRPHRQEIHTTSTRLYVSSDNLCVHSKHVTHVRRADECSSPQDVPIALESDESNHLQQDGAELLDQLEDIAPTFCHEIAGVQIVAKRKAKRYESSVSHIIHSLFHYF